ncbi:MAG TPA: methyltransferase domain-containing protein [Dehalococcoidia bacterium]|nr:methyltransferase domain-containing protein [Dehalococcoidia bacterium]
MTAARADAPILERIGAAWDAAADTYDAQYGHAPSSEAERAAWSGLLLRLLPAQPPLRILDLGTGTGVVALLLAAAGHELTGIDLSPRMLEQASSKARRGRLPIRYDLGDARRLPYADGAFDAVVSRYLIWTLPQPAPALREWIRVIRPGGRVIAIDSLAPRGRALAPIATIAARLLRRTPSGAGARRSVTAPAAGFPLNGPLEPAPVQAAFAEAGLRRVRALELCRLDATLRRAMPLSQRWTRDYRRYLASGFVA